MKFLKSEGLSLHLLNCHFKDYLDQRKLRLWDFFRNIDKDGTMRVPVIDFRKAVQVLTWV